MSVPRTVNMTGGVNVGPVQPVSGFPSLSDNMDLSVLRTYQAGRSQAFSLNNPGAPQNLLAGSGVVRVRYLSIRIRAGSIVLVLTQADGAQEITVSDLLVLSLPLVGTEILALTGEGNADVEMIIAGDPA